MGWSEFDEEEAQAIQARVDAEVAAAVLAEREACKVACVDLSWHFPAGSRERDALQRMAVRLDMRSNVELTGAAPHEQQTKP